MLAFDQIVNSWELQSPELFSLNVLRVNYDFGFKFK